MVRSLPVPPSRLIPFTLAGLALAFGLGVAACAEGGTSCDVIWWSGAPDTSEQVGETSYSYGTSNVDKAVERCATDQAADPDRPATANGHSCDCATD